MHKHPFVNRYSTSHQDRTMRRKNRVQFNQLCRAGAVLQRRRNSCDYVLKTNEVKRTNRKQMNRWKSRMWNKVYKCAFWLTKRWITMFTSTLRLSSWYRFSWRYKTWVSALKPAWYFFKCLFNKYQLTCRRWIFVFILEPDRLFDFRGPVQTTTLGSKKKINSDIQNIRDGPSDVVEKKKFYFITYNLVITGKLALCI